MPWVTIQWFDGRDAETKKRMRAQNGIPGYPIISILIGTTFIALLKKLVKPEFLNNQRKSI